MHSEPICLGYLNTILNKGRTLLLQHAILPEISCCLDLNLQKQHKKNSYLRMLTLQFDVLSCLMYHISKCECYDYIINSIKPLCYNSKPHS